MATRDMSRRKIRHFQGFKSGNLGTFFYYGFHLNSSLIRQILGMAGLPRKQMQLDHMTKP